MKKVGMILLSFLIIGTAYGEMDKQHKLVEILSNGRSNGSVEALASTMRELKMKKREAGEVSDLVCKKFVPQIFAHSGGFLNAMRSVSNMNRCFCNRLWFPEMVLSAISGYIYGYVINYVFARGLFALFGETVKRKVGKTIKQQYQPKIEGLKELVSKDFTNDNLSRDEKNELIEHVKHLHDLKNERVFEKAI